MNAKRTITIEHNGKTYSGHLAAIKSTTFGWEDHGILTASMHCAWTGSGIGVGGYCLDRPGANLKDDRLGSAYGLDHVMRIMETVGVRSWEALPGKQVIVLFDAKPGESTLGSSSVGIAGVLNERVLIFAEHAVAWRDVAEATS